MTANWLQHVKTIAIQMISLVPAHLYDVLRGVKSKAFAKAFPLSPG
jgi:hypothetical protein